MCDCYCVAVAASESILIYSIEKIVDMQHSLDMTFMRS